MKIVQRAVSLVSPIPLLLLTTVAGTAVLGGGSRADIISLLVLRPLTIALLAAAIWRYGAVAWRRSRWLVALAATIVVLAFAHVAPLPPGLWSDLPHRAFVIDSYRDLGASPPWMPLSLSPAMAWNAFFALAAPLTALIAGLGCSHRGHVKLAAALVLLAVTGGILGLLQVADTPGGPLYFYRVTNQTAAVGLFANRNHDALFLGMAFPLLAVFWNGGKLNSLRLRILHIAILSAGALLVPMILLTGSRGGLVTGTIGLVAAIWIGWRVQVVKPVSTPGMPRRGEKAIQWPKMVVAVGVAAALFALMVVLVMRSSSFDRFAHTDPTDELRVAALPYIWHAVVAFWPLGSGAGTFDPVFRMYEPLAMVGPQYLNHAHNDWLETLLCYGFPGALLILCALVLYGAGLYRLVRLRNRFADAHEVPLAWAGAAILAMIAVLSLFDYPLRVPFVEVVAALAAVWMILPAQPSSSSRRGF